MIGKQSGFRHHVVPFGSNGDFSRRLLLPGADESLVKVIKFHGECGSVFPDLVDATDETVYVLSGRIKVTVGETSTEFGLDGLYYIPAGEKRTIEILETGEFLCFFSRADSGPFPDDK